MEIQRSASRIHDRRQHFHDLRSISRLSFNSLTTTSTRSTLKPEDAGDTVSFSDYGSTIPGIGSLSGRAIRTLGQLTLNAVEYASLQMKLTSIGRVLRPSRPIGEGKNFQALYEDVLELSRPGLYPSSITSRALSLLLVQIASRRTQGGLIQALIKWPAVEVDIFLASIMACVDLRWNWSPLSSVTQLRKTYTESLHANEAHRATPFIDFLFNISCASADACTLVCEAGALDILLHFFCVNFEDDTHVQDDSHQAEYVKFSSRDQLALASSRLYEQCILMNACDESHPLSVLWPKDLAFSSNASAIDHYHTRAYAWHLLPSEFIHLRLLAVWRHISCWDTALALKSSSVRNFINWKDHTAIDRKFRAWSILRVIETENHISRSAALREFIESGGPPVEMFLDLIIFANLPDDSSQHWLDLLTFWDPLIETTVDKNVWLPARVEISLALLEVTDQTMVQATLVEEQDHRNDDDATSSNISILKVP